MFFRTTIIASATLALIASMADAHSWADCVDWRFNNPSKPDYSAKGGKCFGWARQYPVNSGIAFGGLDDASPNRHYQQGKDMTPCSDGKHGVEPGADETRQSPISKAYGGKWGTMATVKAGDQMCIRWPAKNHAVKDEVDRGVFINMPQTILTKDPTQSGFLKANIAKLPYKGCNFTSNSDTTPCGGCFTVPASLTTGTYVVQWRWELNPGEFYTSCWDLGVTGAGGDSSTTGGKAIGGSTSVFAELAEDD
ncbi:hypothetical protein EMPS_00272 [Entomortierella parvispora]|uniref:Chitin-binding type-4 domain-containing protein n=1 Tax=Entomortierella parvispora TaxID=205924 RepID=A0A9P3H0A9_9FUNG|nr:hypothetical protein EMPS_00272 [Entomortierella parvispora]